MNTVDMAEAVYAVIDLDQGVCSEGHPCYLSVSVEGYAARICLDPDDAYMGYPLVKCGLSSAAIEAVRPFDPNLAEWASQHECEACA